jgi:hypothetical protein
MKLFEDSGLLVCQAMSPDKEFPAFPNRLVTVLGCSPLKMEAVRSSKVSMTIYHSTRRHISEDSNLHQRRSKNLAWSYLSQYHNP